MHEVAAVQPIIELVLAKLLGKSIRPANTLKMEKSFTFKGTTSGPKVKTLSGSADVFVCTDTNVPQNQLTNVSAYVEVRKYILICIVF